MDEFAIIAKYLRPLAKGYKESLGLGDDAAVFNIPEGYEAVITKDAITENIHFFENTRARFIAKKLLRTNLSDIAAMGGTPKYYLMAAALPAEIDEAWIKEFTESLLEDQKIFKLGLIGGDTIKTLGKLTMSLTMIGIVPKKKYLLRSGAKIGDDIYVSGTIGDAALGLKICKGEISAPVKAEDYLVERYHVPQPRIELGKILAGGLANSCMDISDGLAQDLKHIIKSSNVSADIDFAKVPLSKAALSLKENVDFKETILAGGDDYELIFTASPAKGIRIINAAKEAGIKVTKIGKIVKRTGGRILLLEKGRELKLKKLGFSHSFEK